MNYLRNRKSLAVITPQSSATLFYTTAEMKNFLRVDVSTDDTLIDEFQKIATEAVSQYLHRALATCVLELTMDHFGGDRSLADSLSEGTHDLPKYFGQTNLNAIDLPMPPIVSISSIKTYDRSNTVSTLSTAAYTLDTAGRVYLNNGYNWPTDLRDQNSVAIRYTAGWGYTAIPLPIKNAIRMYTAAMYDCRRMCEMSQEIMDMLGPWRLLDPMGVW